MQDQSDHNNIRVKDYIKTKRNEVSNGRPMPGQGRVDVQKIVP